MKLIKREDYLKEQVLNIMRYSMPDGEFPYLLSEESKKYLKSLDLNNLNFNEIEKKLNSSCVFENSFVCNECLKECDCLVEITNPIEDRGGELYPVSFCKDCIEKFLKLF